jgi:hypothetical protein
MEDNRKILKINTVLLKTHFNRIMNRDLRDKSREVEKLS